MTMYQTQVSGDSSDILYDYLRTIGQYPSLKQEIVLDLVQKVRAKEIRPYNRELFGNLTPYDVLYNCNLRLVVHVAKWYTNQGVDIMDLIQEGNIGLIDAITRYDPNRNTYFSTHAVWWLKQRIGRYIINQGRTIRIPSHAQTKRRKVLRYIDEYYIVNHVRPSDEDIITHCGIECIESLHVLMSSDALSLETTAHGSFGNDTDSITLGDTIIDQYTFEQTDNLELRILEKDTIKSFLRLLLPRERLVLQYRFGLLDDRERTLEEVGRALHCTRERIRQIELAGITKIRNYCQQHQSSSLQDLDIDIPYQYTADYAS